MSELPVELHNVEREALVDQLFAKWDAVFFALYESQRPNEKPPVSSVEPVQAAFVVEDGS